MKPGAPRGEFEWAEVPYPTRVQGQAQVSDGSSSDRALARLYVPDPEQRHGWREFYVYPPDKPRRPTGFRR